MRLTEKLGMISGKLFVEGGRVGLRTPELIGEFHDVEIGRAHV